MMNKRTIVVFASLSIALPLLFCMNIVLGSVSIPLADALSVVFHPDGTPETWRFIILESRLPQAITAMLCGTALATSGLLLQTVFSNPLAGPSILGISSGASLGVAIVILLMGGSISIASVSLSGALAIIVGALIGAMLIMTVIIYLSTLIRSNTMLLIAGIMIGYLASSAITLLNFMATAEGVQSFIVWGMGNFGGVSMESMPVFASTTLLGLALACSLVKPLNALLLGRQYAENLGINIRRTRFLILASTGIMTGVVTAYCGPIAFLGVAVPHIARLILRSGNHKQLLPATLLSGAVLALACNLLCVVFTESVIPLNAVTPIIGAPVIIYVILKGRQ